MYHYHLSGVYMVSFIEVLYEMRFPLVKLSPVRCVNVIVYRGASRSQAHTQRVNSRTKIDLKGDLDSGKNTPCRHEKHRGHPMGQRKTITVWVYEQ